MQTIHELARTVTTGMEMVGYTQCTICSLYMYTLLPLITFHKRHGTEYYDPDLTAEYERIIKQRYNDGEITRGTFYHYKRGLDKITRLNDTGKLLWEPVRKGTMYKLNEYFERLLREFLESGEFHQNTRNDIAWVARSFFSWLVLNGHDNLERVTADEIQQYVVHCAGIMTSASVYNVLLYMRRLCAFLFERGFLTNAYTALLKMSVSRESKMYPAANQDEVAAVLSHIDRSTVRGKRDYAIILLGAVMGLRAVDITRLRLPNIDWLRGEIKIVQAKTGNTNVLPLTKDVGEAVKDYILYARPNSVDDNVFIRLSPPLLAVSDACSIGNLYDRYRERAGLAREPFDGKGFHSLRRALGKNMTTAGVPLTSTAQVLGDLDFNSAKKYISLDREHLAECALDFSVVEVGGGEAQ